jgi:hypothetical protein
MRQHAADQHGAERGHDRHHHGDARTVDQAREHAAPERVGAERECRLAVRRPGGRQEDREQVLLVRIVRREQRREQCDESDRGDDGQAGQHPAGAQPGRSPCHAILKRGLRMT